MPLKEINYAQTITRRIIVRGNVFAFLNNFLPLTIFNETDNNIPIRYVSDVYYPSYSWKDFIESNMNDYAAGYPSNNKYSIEEFISSYILDSIKNDNYKNKSNRVGVTDIITFSCKQDEIDKLIKEINRQASYSTDLEMKFDKLNEDNEFIYKLSIIYPYLPDYKTERYIEIRFDLRDSEEFDSIVKICFANMTFNNSVKVVVDVDDDSYIVRKIEKILFTANTILVSKNTGLYIDKLNEDSPQISYSIGKNIVLGPIDINLDKTKFYEINNGVNYIIGENALLNLVAKDKGAYTIECIKSDKGNKWAGL